MTDLIQGENPEFSAARLFAETHKYHAPQVSLIPTSSGGIIIMSAYGTERKLMKECLCPNEALNFLIDEFNLNLERARDTRRKTSPTKLPDPLAGISVDSFFS